MDNRMSGVTGSDFVRLLHSFVTTSEKDLTNGAIKFTVNPTCLLYLNERYSHELQRQTDSHDRPMVFEIVRVMNRVPCVKIEPSVPGFVDEWSMNLGLYHNIRSLEIYECDPKLIQGLAKTNNQIRKLVCRGGLLSVADIIVGPLLDSCDPSRMTTKVWSKLIWLDCSWNQLTYMDTSLKLLPSVQYINFSHNNISRISNVEECYQLSRLDLSFNQITNLQDVYQLVGCVSHLSLNSNRIASTLGIEKLLALVKLDLGNNVISEFSEIERLQRLPLLVHIRLDGNPISKRPNYRIKVLSMFAERIGFILDGLPASDDECALLSWPGSRSKKRHSKKRIPEIIDLDAEMGSAMQSSFAPSDGALHLASTIERLRHEGGDRWLEIYNLMDSNDPSTQRLEYAQRVAETHGIEEHHLSGFAEKGQGNQLAGSSINSTEDVQLSAFATAIADLSQSPRSAIASIDMKRRKFYVRNSSGENHVVIICGSELSETNLRSGLLVRKRDFRNLLSCNIDQSNPCVYVVEFVIPDSAFSKNGKLNVEVLRYELESEHAVAELHTIMQKWQSNIDFSRILSGRAARMAPDGVPSSQPEAGTQHNQPINPSLLLTSASLLEREACIPPLPSPCSPTLFDLCSPTHAPKTSRLPSMKEVDEKSSRPSSGDIRESDSGIFGSPNTSRAPVHSLSSLDKPGNRQGHHSRLSSIDSDDSSESDSDDTRRVLNFSSRSSDLSSTTQAITISSTVIHASSSSTPMSSVAITPAMSSSLLMSHMSKEPVEEKMDPKIDAFFRTQVLKGRVEKCKYYATCSYVKYGSKPSDERLAHLCLLDNAVYIIKEKKTSKGYEVMCCILPPQLKRIGIGTSSQMIRFETSSSGHVCIMRDKVKTDRFLDVATLVWNQSVKGPSTPEIYFYDVETQPILGQLIENIEGDDAITNFYLMVHLVVPKEDDSCSISRFDSRPVVSRSVCITDERVYLLEDDYLRWPAMSGQNDPPNQQFSCDKWARLREITYLELFGETGCQIFFESDDDGTESCWQIVTGSLNARFGLVQLLASRWKDIFKVDLRIVYR